MLHRKQGSPVDGFAFATPKGTPLDLQIFAQRNIRPELNKAGIAWLGWHALRRGLATNLYRLGVPDQVMQRILRHSNVAVTQRCYIKTADSDATFAMKKLESLICATVVQPASRQEITPANDIAVTGSQTADHTGLGNLAERGGFEPPIQLLTV